MRSFLTLASLTSLVAGQSCSAPAPDASLTVETTSGLFHGFVNSSTPDVNVWLGVPFAEPPVGSQRFLPPLPAYYQGAVNATEYRDICYQDSTHEGVFWLLTTPFQNVDPQSEDCLYLNIWAPRKPVAKKVPVLIWVCGGGYNEGGGHAPYQVPDNWVQRMQTHIVITFK
jgi:carboxylesterase type B